MSFKTFRDRDRLLARGDKIQSERGSWVESSRLAWNNSVGFQTPW